MKRANGEGSIYKRKNGRWAAQFHVTLENGASKRVCVTAKTREAVKIKLQAIIDREKLHLPYDEKDWTVAAYLDYWMRDVQANRIRETTAITYASMIKNHINPVLGKNKLRNLSVPDIRRALHHLGVRGCSARTMIECLRVLSACLNCAMREELVNRNVAQIVEKPKHTPKEAVIWSAGQAARFLQTTRDHPQHIAFMLFLTYGMRRGEVLGLRYLDVDFEHNFIHVRQQLDRLNGAIVARDVKTANSRRTLPLMAHIRTALLDHAQRNNISVPLFSPRPELSTTGTVVVGKTGTPLEPKSLERSFHILTERAGLPRITIHAMRHTAATTLKDLGVPAKDAQIILGHANISTTLNIYQHGTPETHRTAIAAMEERLFAGKPQIVSENVSNHVSNVR